MGWLFQGLVAPIIVAILVGWFAWLVNIYLTALKSRNSNNPKDFNELRASLDLSTGVESVYVRTLRRFLGVLDRFFEGKPYKAEPKPQENWEKRFERFWQLVYFRPADYRRANEIRVPGWQPFAWSAATYDKCLLLAVAYPVLLALISWFAVGDAGEMGRAIGLEPSDNIWARLFFLGGLVPFIFIFGLFLRIDSNWQWLFLAVALAIAFGFPSLFDTIYPDESRRAVAFAVAVAGAVAGAGAVAFAVAVVVAVVVAVRMNRLGGFLIAVSILYFVAVFSIAYGAAGPDISRARFGLLIGLVLLPLVNAPFDWASIGLTRWLLRKNLATQSARLRLLYSAVDFFGAMALLVVLSVAAIIAIEGFNAAGRAGGMTAPMVDLPTILGDIRADPYAGKHFWIYFALFSTLIPTVLHLAVYLASVLTVQIPLVRNWLVHAIDNRLEGSPVTRKYVALVLALRWVVSGVLALTLAILVFVTAGNIPWLGGNLLTLLMWVQRLAAALFA